MNTDVNSAAPDRKRDHRHGGDHDPSHHRNQEPRPGDEQRNGIQVIARSAQILRVLGAHPQGLSLAAIAEHSQLPRSTVQRIVNALCDELLVEACASGSGFHLGPALGKLLFQTQTDIIAEVRPLLEKLSLLFNESIYLASRAGAMANVLDRIIAEHTLRIVFPVGHSAPLHSTAAGKALLALLEGPALDEFLRQPLPAHSTRSVDTAALARQIVEIRRTGIATDFDEYAPGICAFAVGLDTYLGQFAAGVVLPSARRGQRDKAICAALLEFKASVEARIGRRNPA